MPLEGPSWSSTHPTRALSSTPPTDWPLFPQHHRTVETFILSAEHLSLSSNAAAYRAAVLRGLAGRPSPAWRPPQFQCYSGPTCPSSGLLLLTISTQGPWRAWTSRFLLASALNFCYSLGGCLGMWSHVSLPVSLFQARPFSIAVGHVRF